LADVERTYIEHVWRECGGNLSLTARVLDLDRKTVYERLRRYGLKPYPSAGR
jgi:two-component system, NtrC family, response regulator HydG